jgi:hypothetical protein
VDLPGVPVQRHTGPRLEPHQLGPAVSSETQRAERLARPERNPRHPLGVQRPGRLNVTWRMVSSRGVRYANVTIEMAYHLGPIRLVFFGPMSAHPASSAGPAESRNRHRVGGADAMPYHHRTGMYVRCVSVLGRMGIQVPRDA